DLAYSESTDPREGWVSLLEKAFADRYGSYKKLEGGYPSRAYRMLTGRPADTFWVKQQKPDSLFRVMPEADPRGDLIMAEWRHYRARGRLISMAKHKLEPLHDDGVRRVFERGGKRFVELRNPWGHHAPENAQHVDNGIFELPFDDFVRNYVAVFVGR